MLITSVTHIFLRGKNIYCEVRRILWASGRNSGVDILTLKRLYVNFIRACRCEYKQLHKKTHFNFWESNAFDSLRVTSCILGLFHSWGSPCNYIFVNNVAELNLCLRFNARQWMRSSFQMFGETSSVWSVLPYTCNCWQYWKLMVHISSKRKRNDNIQTLLSLTTPASRCLVHGDAHHRGVGICVLLPASKEVRPVNRCHMLRTNSVQRKPLNPEEPIKTVLAKRTTTEPYIHQINVRVGSPKTKYRDTVHAGWPYGRYVYYSKNRDHKGTVRCFDFILKCKTTQQWVTISNSYTHRKTQRVQICMSLCVCVWEREVEQ